MNIEELVVKHAEWIYNKARKYYHNKIDAEDLAGETIYKCLSQGRKFDNMRDFKPWVLAIMENTFITQYNRRKCVLFTDYSETEDYTGHDYADQLAIVNCMLAVIRECNLKSCCMECVLLYAKGYSYEEIANIKGIPIGTVRSRVSAGRKMLRDALK